MKCLEEKMKNNIRLITLCGSMKFQKEMQEISGKLELEHHCIVIQCAYFEKESDLSAEDIARLREIHYQKIAMSDAIYVMNVGGYIGESTRREIAYAVSLGKEIFSLEPLS